MKLWSPSAMVAASILVDLTFANPCSQILRQVIPHTTIHSAVESTKLGKSTRNESYCRVTGGVEYGIRDQSAKNTVDFELFLPSPKSFNGRFMVVGKDPKRLLSIVRRS